MKSTFVHAALIATLTLGSAVSAHALTQYFPPQLTYPEDFKGEAAKKTAEVAQVQKDAAAE